MAVSFHGERAVIPPPDPFDEQRAKQIVGSSRIVAWLDRAIDVPGHAWETSRVRRLLLPTLRQISSSTPAEQVRLAGGVLLVATITHVALYLVFSGRVGWWTWTAWILFAAAAAALAAWPAEISAAWQDSLVRRWTRRTR